MRDIRFLCTHSLRLMCIEWLGGYVRFPLCYRWIFHRIEISSRLDVRPLRQLLFIFRLRGGNQIK